MHVVRLQFASCCDQAVKVKVKTCHLHRTLTADPLFALTGQLGGRGRGGGGEEG